MCLHLLTILTGQGHICKVPVLSQISKGRAYILFEVVPLQTQPFIKARHFFLNDKNRKSYNMDLKEMESNGSKRPTKEQFWPQIDVSMFVTATIFYAQEVSIKLPQIYIQTTQSLSYLFKLRFMQSRS